MDVSLESDEQRIMEGWLYVVRSNKLGFKYLRKRYYVLQNGHFKSFRSIPHSLHKDPVTNTIINSCSCVTDNGRKSIRGKVFFIFTICGISSNGGCLKLGARNPEEAARWVEAFQKVSLKQNAGDNLDCAKDKQQYSRSNDFGGVRDTNSVDNPFSLASIIDHETVDMSSYYTIFSCHNGLRLFKEARHEDHKKRNGHPAIAAMTVINGAPEAVFQILMSLGSSRSEWDFCFQKGSVIESIDGHTDVIHKLLNDDWLPWGMKQRDLLLQRYWSRQEDGTYVIHYHSVHHEKCPPQKNYARACLKSGGYVISPVDQSKQSVVRHMLDIDWKLWRSYLEKNYNQSISIHMIGRLAALREFFKTNLANYIEEDSLRNFRFQSNGNDESKVPSDQLDLVEVDDESDEFFDPSETFLDDPTQMVCEDGLLCNYNITLPEDLTGNLPNSWSVPEPSLFQIRGKTYLKDRKKITAKSTLLQTVAVDWLKSDKREDNLAARPGSIVQKFAADGRPEFFVVINFQTPGSTNYSIASYHMTSTPLKDLPLLEKFVEGDDAFRNSRFKFINHITTGPWILKQSASRACLVGQLLKINYVRGKNYIELDVDVGSAAFARGIASTALGYYSSLIAENAFLIQANTQDELPEHLYGSTRLNYLDVSKAFWANP